MGGAALFDVPGESRNPYLLQSSLPDPRLPPGPGSLSQIKIEIEKPSHPAGQGRRCSDVLGDSQPLPRAPEDAPGAGDSARADAGMGSQEQVCGRSGLEDRGQHGHSGGQESVGGAAAGVGRKQRQCGVGGGSVHAHVAGGGAHIHGTLP